MTASDARPPSDDRERSDPTNGSVAEKWQNLDYPDLAEGWAFPTPEGREHYFREGRSFCGRYRIEPGARLAGRMDYADDPCLTCDRVVTAEMKRLWCDHGDPRDECPDCIDAHTEQKGTGA